MTEYGGKGINNITKKQQNSIHQDKREIKKKTSVYNPFLYFMGFEQFFCYKSVLHIIQHKIDKQ